MPKATPPFIRFHEKVHKGPDCWAWLGQLTPKGYGQLKVFGRFVSAHRFAHELYNGPIPDGMHVLHACDNKRCVNPAHLRIGTHAENMKEAAERGRMRCGSNHPMFGRPNPRPKQANRVCVLGKEYPSQRSAEQALGLGSGTVRYWIKHRPEKAKIVTKGVQCQAA